MAELHTLGRGKGIKIINIPVAKLKTREEHVAGMVVLGKQAPLTVLAGKRHLTLKPSHLAHYTVGRGKRGLKLPRGFQRVDGLEAKSPS